MIGESLDGFPVWKTINSGNCSHFDHFWHFLHPNFCRFCLNDLKFAEKVPLVEIHKLCKNHDPSILSEHVAHKFFFWKIEKRPIFRHFIEVFTPHLYKWSSNFLRFSRKSSLNEFHTISKNDDYRTTFAFVAFLEKSDFFCNFSRFSSQIYLLKITL